MQNNKRKRLAPYLVKQRGKLFYKLWEEVKGNFTMSELAEILDFPLDQLFKIIKAESEKHEKSKI